RPPDPTLLPYTTLFRSSCINGSTTNCRAAKGTGYRIDFRGRESGRWLRTGVLAFLAAVLAGCTGVPVSTDYNTGYAFQSASSYADRKSTRLNSSHVKIS